MHPLIISGFAAVAVGLMGGRIVLALTPDAAPPRPAAVVASASSPVPSAWQAPSSPASTNAPDPASAPPTHAVDAPAFSPAVPPVVVTEIKADRAVVTRGKQRKW